MFLYANLFPNDKKVLYLWRMSRILTEITPLSESDCFYLVDRIKKEFDYPMHRHKEVELNLVCNCTGCQRVVGDSAEVIDYYDLVIVGSDLEHGWLQNGMPPKDKMREITIQWDKSTFNDEILDKNQFSSIKGLLSKTSQGVVFGQNVIKEILPKFDELVNPQPGFMRFLKFLEILFYLSVTNDCKTLSTTSFANVEESINSRRIKKIKDYIASHYQEILSLEELASIAGMTPTAFSRFFKLHTNQTLSDHIIDIRLGHAIRLLVDTTMTSAEICYACGFNNLSNFNRLFKKKKGCSPSEFRAKYMKTKIII